MEEEQCWGMLSALFLLPLEFMKIDYYGVFLAIIIILIMEFMVGLVVFH